jgi:hypothetical protein
MQAVEDGHMLGQAVDGAGPIIFDPHAAQCRVDPVQLTQVVVTVLGAPPPEAREPNDDSFVHMLNWLKSMQARTQPNANVDHGFSHSIVIIMAAQSYWSGKRLYWNPETEEIVDQPVKRTA